MFSILKNLLNKISSKSHTFELNSLEQEQAEKYISPSKSSDKKALKSKVKNVNKHGIPVLNNEDDFNYFKDELKQKNPPSSPPKKNKKSLKSKQKNLNKHGIPVLKNGDNLNFKEEAEQKTASPCVSQKKKTKNKKSGKKKNKKLNKHGIPVLKKDADLSECFKNVPHEKETENPHLPHVNILKSEKKKKRKPPANKHGIRILKKEEDLSAYFNDSSDNIPEIQTIFNEKEPDVDIAKDNFEEMLEKSLAEKDIYSILQEKNDIKGQVPMSREQKIKTYPLPQKELDLHGCTAAQAIEKTDIFIQNARYNGMRTLFIIVGKGIHSNGKAVLRDVIEVKLMDFKKQKIVLDFKWEKGVKWKSGAIIVYMNDSFL